MIALSDVADEDSAAHHVVDASDIIIDAGSCSGLKGICGFTGTSCCDGEEYDLSNIRTPIIFVLISWHDVSPSYFSSLLVINLCFLLGLVCFVSFSYCVKPTQCAARGQSCYGTDCCDGEEYNLSNIVIPIIFFLLISWRDILSSFVSSLLVTNTCFLSGKCDHSLNDFDGRCV